MVCRLWFMVFRCLVCWFGLFIGWFWGMVSWLGCYIQLLWLMVVMMIMVAILVVLFGIATMHRKAKDHLHAERVPCKLAFGVSNLLLRWCMILWLWSLVGWLGSLISWFWCSILSVEAKYFFQTSSMNWGRISNRLLMRWMHCHHVMMMRLNMIVVGIMVWGHCDSGHRSMMATMVIYMPMGRVMSNN